MTKSTKKLVSIDIKSVSSHPKQRRNKIISQKKVKKN